MKVRICGQAGFSFPEVIVATGILAFALTALIGFFVNSVALNEAARNTTTALSHAQVVMESIRNTSFVYVPTYIDNGNWNWDSTALTSQGLVPLKNETVATTSSGSGLLTVTVTVTWNDTAGRSRNVVLTTMMGGA